MSDAPSALERFSAPTRTWFEAAFARADPGPVGRLGGDRRRAARAGGGADRLGQDAVGVPVGDRPAADRGPRPPEKRHPGALRLAAQGARGRRRAQPAGAADRHPADRRAARHAPARPHRRASAPATPRPAERRTLARTPPDILITTPESLFLMLTSQARETPAPRRDRDRRRGARRRRHQARRPPRRSRLERLDALLDAARPADRPVGDRAAARRGRAVPRRHARRSRSSPRRRPRSGTSRSSSRSRT